MGEHFFGLLGDLTICGEYFLGLVEYLVLWGHVLGFLEDLTSCGGALFWTFGGFNVLWGGPFWAFWGS